MTPLADFDSETRDQAKRKYLWYPLAPYPVDDRCEAASRFRAFQSAGLLDSVKVDPFLLRWSISLAVKRVTVRISKTYHAASLGNFFSLLFLSLSRCATRGLTHLQEHESEKQQHFRLFLRTSVTTGPKDAS